MSKPSILIVEDNPVVFKLLEGTLTYRGYDVMTATNGAEALKAATARVPDLLILDLTLDGDPSDALRDGFALLGFLRFKLPGTQFPVIIHTEDQSPRVDARSKSEGVFAVTRKSKGVRELIETVERALKEFGQSLKNTAA